MKEIKKKEILGIFLLLIGCLPLYVFAAKTNREAFALLLGIGVLFALFSLYMIRQSRKEGDLLRRERDHLSQTLDRIPLPLFVVDAQRNLQFINTAARVLFHCGGDRIGQPCHCLNTCICDTPECAIDKMERTGNGRTYYDMDGKSYRVSTASLDNESEIGGKYIELIEEITEIVETQKTLEEKTVELETMSENLIGGVLITAMREGFPVIRCNRGYRELIQKEDKQIIGQCAMKWVVAEDAVRLTQKIKQQLLNGNNVNIEHRLHDESNGSIWVSLRGKRTVLRGEEVGVWILTDISSNKEAELALKVDEERYRIAMQSIEDIIIDYDMKTHVMYHSSKAQEIYGVAEIVENMPQHILDTGTVLAESRTEYLDLFRQLAEGVEKCSCILQARAADGRILWDRLTFTAIFDEEGNPVRAIGILQDITREKNVEFQYKREARYLELSGREGTFYYEADMTRRCFISGHETIVKAYCETPTDDFDTIIELLISHMVYEPDRESVRAQINRAVLMSDYEAGTLHKNVEYRRDMNGEVTWVSCSIQSFFDEDTKNLHYVGCIRNINEMKKKELFLQQKAERDLLTGLYNKGTTERLIQCATKAAIEDQSMGAFLLIDLDNFKNVNDTLGHAFGDAVLSEVSRGFLSLFCKDDIVGRIGGDEFVAYMGQIKNEEFAIKKAKQVCKMFHRMYTGVNNNYKISGTIGISLFPSHGESFDELYKKADRAMYYAKEEGKDNYAIFTPSLPRTDDVRTGTRVIDANSGKRFAENISEYVLRILYESADSNRAICAILELLSNHFHFNRGYIFEYMGDGWNSTYEWQAQKSASAISEMLTFPWEVLQNNGRTFDRNGVFTVNITDKGRKKERSFLETQKIRTMVWFSAMNNGLLQAVIGFDSCSDSLAPSEADIAVLQQSTMLIGIFLLNHRCKQNLNNPSIAAERVMDSIGHIVYVVDPNDFSLYYLNRIARTHIPNAHRGDKCYESVCGRQEPCEKCVLRRFLQGKEKRLRTKVLDESYQTWLDVTVSNILWQNGKQYCLVECIKTL